MEKLRSYAFSILFKNTENPIKFGATESYAGEGDMWKDVISKMRAFEYSFDECDCHRQHIINIDEVYIDLTAAVFIAMTEITRKD